jgi:hypothetical protein
MTKYNKKKKMNRHKSVGANRMPSRGGNNNQRQVVNYDNNINRQSNNMDIMRMSDFDQFDRMFENIGMPRFGGGMDIFRDFRSRFDDLERDMFSK